MTEVFRTIGVIFARNDTGDFPTLADVEKTNHVNTYSLDVEDFRGWYAVAWYPRVLMYADDDREAMDETNFDAIREVLCESDSELPIIASAMGTPTDRFAWFTDGIEEAKDAGYALVDRRVLIVSPDMEDELETLRDYSRALDDVSLRRRDLSLSRGGIM